MLLYLLQLVQAHYFVGIVPVGIAAAHANSSLYSTGIWQLGLIENALTSNDHPLFSVPFFLLCRSDTTAYGRFFAVLHIVYRSQFVAIPTWIRT